MKRSGNVAHTVSKMELRKHLNSESSQMYKKHVIQRNIPVFVVLVSSIARDILSQKDIQQRLQNCYVPMMR